MSVGIPVSLSGFWALFQLSKGSTKTEETHEQKTISASGCFVDRLRGQPIFQIKTSRRVADHIQTRDTVIKSASILARGSIGVKIGTDAKERLRP